MRKKAICFLFAFVLMLSAFPVTALADENYGIMVGGTVIDASNASDVFGDGTVSFDPDTNTLTLNGGEIYGKLFDDFYGGIIIIRESKTVINVTAETKIICTEKPGEVLCGIYCKNDLSVTGGDLKIYLAPSAEAYGIYSGGAFDFTEANAYVDASNASDTGFAVYGSVSAGIEKSTLRLYGNTSAFAGGDIYYGNGTHLEGYNEPTEEHAGYYYHLSYPDKPVKPDDPPVPPEDELPPVEEEEEEIINTDTDIKDVKGSRFRPLMLKATAKGRTITLTWKKAIGADGYIIYGARCGQPLKRLKTIKNGNTVKRRYKNLKKGKYYRYIVVAYKNTEKGSAVITKSKSVHCKTKGGKKGNPTGIRLKTKVLTLKRGKTQTLKPVLLCNKPVATHIAKFRYESSDTDTVTVNKNGKITAKKVGVAYVYVITQNGLYKKVKVTVK